ncbi:POTRA domain-containing protein [Melittangium boletus]|uniref:POTRA domain-containing protein n=1 Tax=Melittangium boletus TaxID=83453 RepID=UPI003DA2F0D1
MVSPLPPPRRRPAAASWSPARLGLVLRWVLVCALWLGTGPAAAQEPPREAAPTVASVELHLPEGVDAKGLADLVAVRTGQPLSARAVRRSVERLWASERFADIVVRSVPESGGVRVVFELTPIQVVREVDVEGNVILRDDTLLEVLRAEGLVVGQRLDEDALGAAVTALSRAYGRQGYNEARIQLTRESAPGGVALVFTVFEGRPTQVAAVSVTGSPGLALAELLDTLGLRVGGVLDRGGLDAGLVRLQALLRERGFWLATVGQPLLEEEGGAATVVVPVSAGPHYRVRFHGNHHFSDTLLSRVLQHDVSEPLEELAVARMVRQLESFYRYRGFHGVHVEVREVDRPDGEARVLAFDIEEGRPLRMRRVHFRGNTVFSPETLRELLAERVRLNTPQPSSPPRLSGVAEMGPVGARGGPPEWLSEPATVFVEEAYRDAAETMTEAYRERGYLEAEVRFVRVAVDLTTGTAEAWFDVREGAQLLVAGVQLEGGPVGFDGRRFVEVRAGDALNPDTVELARRSLVTQLNREGYLFARVEAEPRRADTGVELLFRMEPGPQARLGRLLVRGTQRTYEEVVRDTVRLREDEVLSPEKLFDSQRRLVLLNIFRQVTVRLDKPDVPEASKDVVVEVRERPRWEGEIAGGYFLSEGPRVVLDAARTNVDGRGLNLSGRLKLNYVGLSAQGIQAASALRVTCATLPDECPRLGAYDWLSAFGGRAVLSAAQPRLHGLLPLDVGARLDLIAERVQRPSYLSSRIAAVTGLDWSIIRWLNFALQYELEGNLLQSGTRPPATLDRADQERLRFPYGFFILHSLRSSLAMDLRDNPGNPHKGLLVSTSAEWMRDLRSYETTASGEPLTALPINGVKLSGNVSVYAPLSSRAVLAVSLRAGTIVPLVTDARVIGSKRFFLGGSNSLRGFREDGILGEDRRTELRRQVGYCRSLVHPAACSAELLTLLGGQPPISEGGELFTLAKTELRFPVRPSFDLGLFLEAGNLWLDRTKYQALALRYSMGVGFRYITPVGPLAFDVGVNLDPDETLNESVGQLHFSIGAF